MAEADQQLEEELELDEVKENLYVAMRSAERFTANVRALVEDLDKKQEGDAWLEQVQEEMLKALQFYEGQLASFTAFSGRVDAYVESVRKDAEEDAIEELQVEKKDGEGVPARRRRAKTVHPELTKFKLEKQARILGKYGGVPAMGGGMVLGRLPKEVILKATASPAAVEIQYSKVEGKDARYLAEVMRFKTAKQKSAALAGANALSTPSAAGGSSGYSTYTGEAGLGDAEVSPWQEEVMGRKGKLFFREHEAPAEASTASHAAYAGELAEKLKAQQASLAAAEAAAAAAAKRKSSGGGGDPAAPTIAAAASSELADKLKRQQAALKASEEAVAAAAAEAAAAAVPPPPAAWANAAAPFGGELVAAMRERQARAAAAAAAAAAEAAGAGGAAAGAAGPSRAAPPDASPGFSFRAASNAIAGAAPASVAGAAGAPASQAPSAASVALRRAPAAPPPGAGPAPAAGAAGNELEEALRRRQARQAAAEAEAGGAGA